VRVPALGLARTLLTLRSRACWVVPYGSAPVLRVSRGQLSAIFAACFTGLASTQVHRREKMNFSASKGQELWQRIRSTTTSIKHEQRHGHTPHRSVQRVHTQPTAYMLHRRTKVNEELGNQPDEMLRAHNITLSSHDRRRAPCPSAASGRACSTGHEELSR